MQDKPKVGICAGNIELIDGDGHLHPEKKQRRDVPFRSLDFDDLFMDRKPFPPAPTMLIRREALEQVGGFDPLIPLEDLLIQLKITAAGYTIDALDVVMARYRQHASNTYKNHRYMIQNILKTYAKFSEHPAYDAVRYNFLNSMFLKTADRDRPLAREILKQIPLKFWGRKTLRGLVRLYLMPLRS